MSFVCSKCNGTGVSAISEDVPCEMCGGREVLIGHFANCPACKGAGSFFNADTNKVVTCSDCKGKGSVVTYARPTSPIRTVPVDEIQRALVVLKGSSAQLDEGLTDPSVDPYVIGVTVTLLEASEQHRIADNWEPGELFNTLTTGVLRITPSGIWHFPDPEQGEAVRIVQFATVG